MLPALGWPVPMDPLPPTHTFCATAGANPHTTRNKAGWVGRMQMGEQAWCRKLGEAVFWQLRVAWEARSAAQCEDGRWGWSSMKHLFTINREQMAWRSSRIAIYLSSLRREQVAWRPCMIARQRPESP